MQEVMYVPVVSSIGNPLMPCHPARARQLISKGKAVGKFNKGLYYIKLIEKSDGDTQPVVIGIDPGSKMEGYTVKSASRTYFNLQSHARNGNSVKQALETRKNARRSRRYRNTPYRQCRPNRAKTKNWIPPSTRARWQFKLNIFYWLRKLYPITIVVVEDVRTEFKEGQKRRHLNFSPVMVGKNWFYDHIRETRVTLELVTGLQTSMFRKALGLFKSLIKLSTDFSAHCVDSWVISNHFLGNQVTPDLTKVIVLKPLTFTRRQLHRFNPSKGGSRTRYGGTRSLYLKKGTLVTHPKYGRCLVGGSNNVDRVSLHTEISYNRVTQNAKPEDLKVISYSPWVLIGNTHPLSVKLERRQVRRNTASLRSSLQGSTMNR